LIYLDHNSTTPIAPSVAKVIAECYAAGFMNPASQHQPGQRARKKLESCRCNIAQMLGAETTGMRTDSLVFTSGGTESDNLGVIGLALSNLAANPSVSKRIVLSAVEHPAVVQAGEYLKTLGFVVDVIPVDSNGVILLKELESLLKTPAAAVSVMLANNETGVLQPVTQAAAICRERNVPIHTDAVQAVGKIPVDFGALGVDALTFTGHKLHGPRGIGGLLVRHGVTIQPLLFGGFQQMGTRPGTEDIALVAGLEQTLRLFTDSPSTRFKHLLHMHDRMLAHLRKGIPNIVVNGGEAEKLPQTLNVSVPGVDRQAFLMAADMNGIAISTGSACASGSSEPSPVLLAMGASEDTVLGAIRISVGMTTTEAEIDLAAEQFVQIFRGLSGSA
jgi:cysteine desulfurase